MLLDVDAGSVCVYECTSTGVCGGQVLVPCAAAVRTWSWVLRRQHRLVLLSRRGSALATNFHARLCVQGFFIMEILYPLALQDGWILQIKNPELSGC